MWLSWRRTEGEGLGVVDVVDDDLVGDNGGLGWDGMKLEERTTGGTWEV